MKKLIRHATVGVVAGCLLTALTTVVLPAFFTRVYELAFFPLIGVLLGLMTGTIAAAASRRRSAAKPRQAIGPRLTAAVVASALLSLVLYAAVSSARSWTVAPRLIVFGVDGATWDIMTPMIESGRLPNLAKLQREGTSAVLMSDEPMYSQILWTTIGTGVHPDKHGVKTFYDTQDHLQAKRFWEVFEDNGHSLGLFRWWITWPPRVRNGFVIPDILARDAQSMPPAYNFVNQLRLDMKSGQLKSPLAALRIGWRYLRAGTQLHTCLAIARDVLPALRSGEYADFHIASRRAEIRLNGEIYKRLLREFEPAFTCFYDNGVDQMCHFYWQFHEPGQFDDLSAEDIERYRDVIPDYYALTDAVIGDILAHVDESTSIVVLSDHGFAAEVTGTTSWYFANGVPILEDLDMDGDYFSIALASRTFVESVKRDPLEANAALEDALTRFQNLKVEETGETLFSPWIEDEGRLQVDVAENLRSLAGHVSTPNGLIPLERWFTERVYAGTHALAGVILGKGPAFRRGHAGETAHLVDVAPTILHTSGFAVSRELDGVVMLEWLVDRLRDESTLTWTDSYGRYDPERSDVEVDEETMKKLRSLGYIR